MKKFGGMPAPGFDGATPCATCGPGGVAGFTASGGAQIESVQCDINVAEAMEQQSKLAAQQAACIDCQFEMKAPDQQGESPNCKLCKELSEELSGGQINPEALQTAVTAAAEGAGGIPPMTPEEIQQASLDGSLGASLPEGYTVGGAGDLTFTAPISLTGPGAGDAGGFVYDPGTYIEPLPPGESLGFFLDESIVSVAGGGGGLTGIDLLRSNLVQTFSVPGLEQELMVDLTCFDIIFQIQDLIAGQKILMDPSMSLQSITQSLIDYLVGTACSKFEEFFSEAMGQVTGQIGNIFNFNFLPAGMANLFTIQQVPLNQSGFEVIGGGSIACALGSNDPACAGGP